MKITHLNSATELIEANGLKILTDPWLIDGIYYGSWGIFPPFEWEKQQYLLSDIDYIYVSHIHPDHLCEKTMKRLGNEMPILIHRYNDKFLKMKLISLGFEVIELENGIRTSLGNDLYMTIFAADNCDPSVCGRLFSCASYLQLDHNAKGSLQIDSLCVLDDGKHVVLNTNDCPYLMSKAALDRVKERYENIDFLLVGYTGASLYPFAMADYSSQEKKVAAERIKEKCLDNAASLVEHIKPRYFMPFAGTYVLGGTNWELNEFSPIPELQEAAIAISTSPRVQPHGASHVLLNAGESFDLETEKCSKPYEPIDPEHRYRYLRDVLAKRKYDFEEDPWPSWEDFMQVLPAALQRLESRVGTLKYSSKCKVSLDICDGKILCLSFEDGFSHELVEGAKTPLPEPFVHFSLDPRLLLRVLRGPKYAHWNNVENAALLKMIRRPDTYEMGVHHILCYLHK